MMATKSTKLLTLDDAASFLGVSKVSLRRWTNDGLLECHRIGPQGRRRFDLEQLRTFAERSSPGSRQESEPREFTNGRDDGHKVYKATHA